MPRFRVRTDDPNSDEFRVYYLSAETEEEARASIERKEQAHVMARLDTEQLAALEAKEADGSLTRKEYGALHGHRLAEPYKITYAFAREV